MSVLYIVPNFVMKKRCWWVEMAPGNLKPSYGLLRDLLSHVINPHRHILIHKIKKI